MQQHHKRPSTIIFDLGGVLIDWNPLHLYNKMFNGNERELEFFLTEVCSMEWNARQDEGRPFAEGIAERVALYPDYKVYIEAYFSRWIETIKGPIHGTVNIFQRLKAGGYPIFALSNWSAETYPLVYEQFEFLKWFDDVVLSGEERVAKPNPAIYEILLQRAQRAAADCLFIDDSEKNIEMARTLGFQTIHFTNADSLGLELNRRNLLT